MGEKTGGGSDDNKRADGEERMKVDEVKVSRSSVSQRLSVYVSSVYLPGYGYN